MKTGDIHALRVYSSGRISAPREFMRWCGVPHVEYSSFLLHAYQLAKCTYEMHIFLGGIFMRFQGTLGLWGPQKACPVHSLAAQCSHARLFWDENVFQGRRIILVMFSLHHYFVHQLTFLSFAPPPCPSPDKKKLFWIQRKQRKVKKQICSEPVVPSQKREVRQDWQRMVPWHFCLVTCSSTALLCLLETTVFLGLRKHENFCSVCHSIEPPGQKIDERMLEHEVYVDRTVPNY